MELQYLQVLVPMKSTGHSFRFSYLDPDGNSQPSIIPVPEGSTPSSGLFMHQACIWYTDIYDGKTPYTQNNLK